MCKVENLLNDFATCVSLDLIDQANMIAAKIKKSSWFCAGYAAYIAIYAYVAFDMGMSMGVSLMQIHA